MLPASRRTKSRCPKYFRPTTIFAPPRRSPWCGCALRARRGRRPRDRCHRTAHSAQLAHGSRSSTRGNSMPRSSATQRMARSTRSPTKPSPRGGTKVHAICKIFASRSVLTASRDGRSIRESPHATGCSHSGRRFDDPTVGTAPLTAPVASGSALQRPKNHGRTAGTARSGPHQ